MITPDRVNLLLSEPIDRPNLAVFGSRTRSLPLPPDKCGAHHLIPYRPHQRAAEAGNPPWRIVTVDHRGDADIGNGADGADHLKANKTAGELPAGKPLVAICEHVVE